MKKYKHIILPLIPILIIIGLNIIPEKVTNFNKKNELLSTHSVLHKLEEIEYKFGSRAQNPTNKQSAAIWISAPILKNKYLVESAYWKVNNKFTNSGFRIIDLNSIELSGNTMTYYASDISNDEFESFISSENIKEVMESRSLITRSRTKPQIENPYIEYMK